MPAAEFAGRSLFTGCGVALVTPFGEDGRPDEEAMRALVRFHQENGTDALVVNGSTGEAATLSADEQRRMVEVVVEAARGGERRLPVVAGAGGSDTAAVSAIARAARDAGADALLVAPPPYNKPPQRGIALHVRRVMDAADLPTILYNVPGRTACNVLPETVEELAADERLVGLKEASGDISQVAEVTRRVADRIALYSGNDDQIVPLLSLGGRGVISVLANVAPRDTARMVHAYLEGSTAESRNLQLRYLPLVAALFREPNPIPVKAGVELLGFAAGEPRLPLVPAPEGVRREVEEAMRALGLLGG
jgi:4-hydroxy-tetrahydrodipicolinate synthase